MSVFEYLGVLLSVIMGLGLTHILAGLSKIIHYRKTIRFYWVHSLWAFSILMYIVIIWWGMFWWSTQEQWSFFLFLLLILYAVFLFMSASLLFPWNLPEDLDLEEHFFRTRPWFFSILSITWVLDIPETTLKATGHLRELPADYLVFAFFQLSLLLICLFTTNRTAHRIIAIVWPLVMLGYLSTTTLVNIAT